MSYSQIGNSGRLTLLNGGTTVGVLQLSGTYNASQFQVQPTGNGLSSAITYTATPSSAGGNSVSGSSDLYAWNNVNGGVWSNAGNWLDTNTGATPTTAPGAGNAVTIDDSLGTWTSQIITGPATAASLTVEAAANTILTGAMSVAGQFSVAEYGTASGDVAIVGGANVTAGSLNVTSLLRIASASLLTVAGSSTGTFISGTLSVGSDSVVRVSGGTSVITGTVAVDGTSSVEFGTAGTAAAGTLTIDHGQAPTLQGVAMIEANVVVNGSLLVYSGTLEGFGGSAGAISGTGTITIGALGAAGYLILAASDTAAIDFEGYTVNGVAYANESLELKGALRIGTIIGFLAGDAILVDQNVTGATYVQTNNAQGTLTLTDGATTAGTLTFAGNYAGSLFQIDVNPVTGVATISLQTATSAAGAASAGPAGHVYTWTGVSGGSWSTAANWLDTTTTPGVATAVVPGSLDVVSIAGSVGTGQYTAVGGNGAASNLTITANVLLTGQISDSGGMSISTISGPASMLTLEAGAKLTVGGGAQLFGTMEVGGGSSAVINGSLQMVGSSLLALNGSIIQLGTLIGNGGNNVIVVDASSAVRIGTSATTAAGALSVASGAAPAFTGTIYGSVVVNGWFYVNAGGTMLIDMNGTAQSDPYATTPTISGSGVMQLLEGSTLGLGATCGTAIQFLGPDATLELVRIPTNYIYNFAAGDEIQVDQSVSGLTYHQVNATSGTLTLTNGSSTVGVIYLIGNYGGGANAFHLDAAPNGDAAVITLQSLLAAPAQPTSIQGWGGADLLTATANGQKISGEGGGDTLSGGSFAGIDFADLTSNLNGVTIQDFAASDMLDFLDMNPTTATETYAGSVLSITDGTHAAALNLTFATTPASGSFHVASDGASGTRIVWS